MTKGLCTACQAYVRRYVPFLLAELNRDPFRNFDMGSPELRLCASFPGKEHKSDPHRLFQGVFLVEKGAPNRPFWATNVCSEGRGRKKPIDINNFAGLSRKWVGVKLFMCFPFSTGKRETHKTIPRKSQEKAGRVPGQSRDNPGTIP